MVNLRSKFLLGLCILVTVPSGMALDDDLYYMLGGGEPISRAPSNRSKPLVIGGDISWNTDLMCGDFDMALSVENQLKGVEGAFSDLMGNIINSAQGTIASLPAMVIQRVNPALYDLLQNGVLQASEEFHIAQVSCESMTDAMGDVIDGGGWEEVATGVYWGKESQKGGDILTTKRDASVKGPNGGVVWVGGNKRGGAGQPPVVLVGDTAKAGYNILLERAPDNKSSTTGTCSGSSICEQWVSPQAFSDWMVAVVGEEKIRTCVDCDKVDTQAGMGLAKQVGIEQVKIAEKLKELVESDNAPSQDDLKAVSGGPGMLISRRVIESLRGEKPEEQLVLIDRLSSEMAVVRTMERSMIARRAMLAGMKEPNIAQIGIAEESLETYVDELTQEMENLLFEMEVRERVASNTTTFLLRRDMSRKQAPIVESAPQAHFLDGATLEK